VLPDNVNTTVQHNLNIKEVDVGWVCGMHGIEEENSYKILIGSENTIWETWVYFIRFFSVYLTTL
jgi:hypothetical protein